jgi:tetratricopeptide (TPR) repeat protein
MVLLSKQPGWRRLGVIACLLWFSFVGRSNAVSPESFSQCFEPRNADSTISSCTEMIEEANKARRTVYWPYVNRGIAFRKQGELARAIEDFDAAIKTVASDPKSFVERGNTYLQIADWKRAADDFDAAIKLDPKNAKAHAGRAICFGKTKQFAEAVAEDLAAIQADVTLMLPVVNLGTHYLANGETDKALEAFQRALSWPYQSLSPKELAHIHYGIGSVHVRRRELTEAINEYTIAIGFNKNYSDAYFMRAQLFQLQGDLAKAEEDRRILNNLSQK